MAERQVRVAVVMDDSSYVAGGASVVGTNTKIAKSEEDLAAITKKTADAQVAAILRVREASKLKIGNLQNIASNAPNIETQTAATVALQREQAKLARTYGETSLATGNFSKASKTAEVDLNKIVRGGLAGSGALSALGRSLAFASSGFIAFAVGATVIKASISAAQDEAVAQRQVARQLVTSGKSWSEYGKQIDSVLLKESHLAGFTKADLLQSFGYLVRVGGNVQKSLKLTSLAADVARARNLSLASASIALAKALGGSATALRRLGIIVPKHVSTTEALAFVTQKFAGQAEASTTATEKFHATLVDTGATIGTALLPTFDRLVTNLGDWFAKMNESGKLTQDVNNILSTTGHIFHDIATAIKTVDEVTGSFKTTLEALIAFRLAFLVTGWVTALKGLAGSWGLVADSANAAAGAQERALAAGGGAAGAEGAAAGVAGGAAARGGIRGAVAGGLSNANIVAIAAIVATVILNNKKYQDTQKTLQERLGHFGFLTLPITKVFQPIADRLRNQSTYIDSLLGQAVGVSAPPVTTRFGRPAVPESLTAPGFGQRRGALLTGTGPFGTAQPLTIFKSFTDTISNQLAAARAALTKSTADDVAAAKAEIVFIKKEIASGHLAGTSLIQALQAEASAVNTIQSAEAAEAQKRAAAAAKEKAKIQAQIAASIDPIRLEVELARAQSEGKRGDKAALNALRALRRAAEKAIASGNLTLQEQLQAYQQITSLNQQIAQATKKNTQVGLGKFKELNTRQLTAGLNLTPAQRAALRARLSQVGPHGTVPGDGTGAFGFVLGKNDRPVHVHNHVYIDGKPVSESVTRHQQRRRRRNSSQRRGPVAGGDG